MRTVFFLTAVRITTSNLRSTWEANRSRVFMRGVEFMYVMRNVTISGHRTSIRLEPEMWDAFGEICRREGRTIDELCSMVDRRRQGASLTAALRLLIMLYFRAAATEEGHAEAGHGTGAIDLDKVGKPLPAPGATSATN